MSKQITAKLKIAAIAVATTVSLAGTLAVLPQIAHGAGVTLNLTRSLGRGSRGADVTLLQQALATDSSVYPEGTVSGYFGALTEKAVQRFQAKYNIVSSGTPKTTGYGRVGPSTRAKLNSVFGSGVSTPGTGTGTSTTPSTGTGTTSPTVSGVSGALTVAGPASQPAATLAPKNAANLPFVQAVFTASSAGDVTVKDVVVERQGLGSDAAVSSIVLLAENGTIIGTSKTLGSDHRVHLNDGFIVKAGTSRTITIAANLPSSEANESGNVVRFAVVAVDGGSSSVSASFPITGNGMTINNSLTIGSVTMNRGPLDPGANTNKQVGTTGIIFSSVKLTAGSAEDLNVTSIRWNQSGSAASTDIANLMTYVDGNPFPVSVDSSGKYYTTTFPNGYKIAKGNSSEVYIKGDIVSGSGRSVEFDVYRTTDIGLVGLTYGYGATPPAGSAASSLTNEFGNTNPWYVGGQVTVGTGTLRVDTSTSIPAGNISLGTAVQPLGAFTFTVQGEAIQITSLPVTFLLNGSTTAYQTQMNGITSFAVYDQNGAVVAGPLDGTSNTTGILTFTNTFTAPVGTNTYTFKGKVNNPSGVSLNQGNTLQLQLNTPANIAGTGQITGNTISPTPSSAVNASQQTVRTGAVTISVSQSPAAQTVVRNISGFPFAIYNLDTTASGEDIKVTTLSLKDTPGGSANTNTLNSCQVVDGSTALTTGSNVVNPGSNTSATSFTFTLDNPLTIAKGSVKQLTLKCSISSASANNNTHQWGLNTTATAYSATGVASGASITPTINDGGQVMTISTGGTLSVTQDGSSPSYRVAAANTTGNLAQVLRFHVTNEAVTVTQVGLVMTNNIGSAASSSAADITKVWLYDNSNQTNPLNGVNGSVFSSNGNATTTVSNFVVPITSDKLMYAYVDLAPIGISLPGTSGHLVKIDFDSNASDGTASTTKGIGQASGTTIGATGGTTSAAGLRVFRGYPSVASAFAAVAGRPALITNYGSSISGSILYRFSVKANSNDVGLYKFAFRIATSSTPSGTSSTTVTNVKLFGYDSSGNPLSPWTGGQLSAASSSVFGSGTTNMEFFMNGPGAPSDQKAFVPSGQTYYFELVGDITLTGGPTGGSVTTQLQGDAAYPALANGTFMETAALVETDTNNDFIWAPNSTGTSATTLGDWTNGFTVPGLPSTNLDPKNIQK